MAQPKIVLFDIGSTLWSSPPEDPGALAYCYGRGRDVLLQALGDAPPIEALIDAVEGYFAEWEEVWRQDSTKVHQPPTSEYVAEALGRLGVHPAAETLAAFTDAVLETSVYTAKVQPEEPGMSEALAGLKQRGLRLGGVSNAFMGAATLMRIMDERSLGQHLDFMLSSCEAGIRKPHPSIYQQAAEAMGATPDEAIFVGDRLDADVEGPASLGMRTVLTQQYRREDVHSARVKPDAVIQHLSELVAYADSVLKG